MPHHIYAKVFDLRDDHNSVTVRFDFLGSEDIDIPKTDIKKSVLKNLCNGDLFAIDIPENKLKNMLRYIGIGE
jgi:hypothetical protein